MAFRLKSQLQYERNFCNLMTTLGNHAERVAASGRRKDSVCDAITFTLMDVYFTEVKATKQEKFRFKDTHNILEKSKQFNASSLLAIYFKSSHSSKGKGKWVFKIIRDKEIVVNKNDKSDEF